jgi:hypothetical protein
MTPPSISSTSTAVTSSGQPFLVAFDPLAVLPDAERHRRLDAYLDFLRARDGEPDLPQRRLSHREAFFQELAARPVQWTGPLDRRRFHEHLARRATPDLDRKLVWLLAAAKSNRAEHYGVTLDLSLRGDHFAEHENGEHMTYIDLEEFYHTRILRDCCACFGLEFDLMPPRSFTRFFAALVVRSPAKLRLITALCGELFGCVAFQVLWETADVFSAQPEVRDRIRLLIREILIDEMGHTAYGNAMLGAAGLALVRAMVPRVATYFLLDLPEFAILAGGRRAFLERVAAFDLGQNRELWDLAPRAAGAVS